MSHDPCTCSKCDAKAARAAIRRAAFIARQHDTRANGYIQSISEIVITDRIHTDDYLVDVECSANNAWHHRTCADAIRTAIRAAITPNIEHADEKSNKRQAS